MESGIPEVGIGDVDLGFGIEGTRAEAGEPNRRLRPRFPKSQSPPSPLVPKSP